MNFQSKLLCAFFSASLTLVSGCGTSGAVRVSGFGAEVEVEWDASDCGTEETKVGGKLSKCGKSYWGANDAIATVETQNAIVRESSGSATVSVYSGGVLIDSKTFSTTYSGPSTSGMDIYWTNSNTVEGWIDNLDAGPSDQYDIDVDIHNLSYEDLASSGYASSTVTAYLDGDVLAQGTRTWELEGYIE